MDSNGRKPVADLEELKQRRREAAERVRCLLHELSRAELEFECASAELSDALKKAEAA